MSTIKKVRIYHTALAALSIISYMSGELGIIHAWLGYGVALVIALRLLWAFSGNPHVGLMKFYPSFEGLNIKNAATHPAITKVFMLGIVISLLAVTATGIAMDKGKAIGLADTALTTQAYADDGENETSDEGREGDRDDALEEVHELFANMLLLFVGMHVSYLLLFKRPLARFMLFLNKAK